MTPELPKRFDAFLSYNSQDRPAVEELATRLKAEGLALYLAVWELLPGREFQPGLAAALNASKSCVVFLGPNGLGPWQKQELQVAIDKRACDETYHVIPVLLPGSERPRRGDVAHLEFLISASWVEFLTTLDDESAFRSLVSGITGNKPPEADAPRYEGVCPYRGLEPFRPDDAKFFFGREKLTGWLVSALRREVRAAQGVRFLGVLGPSGSGKSSVVLAGLLPRLLTGVIEGSEHWPLAILRPGHDPLKNLAAGVISQFLSPGKAPDVESVIKLIDTLRADTRALDVFAQMALHNRPDDVRLVVVVDQFEEVFTYRPGEGPARVRFEQERDDFIANLLNAAAVAMGRVVVILTMRSDFLSDCAKFPQLSAVLSAHQELVGPMTATELRAAIESPAYLVGCEVEPALTQRLLADVAGQSGALPLLQFALKEVWSNRVVRRLTLRAYTELGKDDDGEERGIEGVLDHRANEIYRSLTSESQDLCRRLFLRLVQPGEGTGDTKRRVPYRELLPDDPERAAGVRKLVQTLTARDARLITTERTGATEGVVEVAHEALIRGWTQLRQWVDSERAGLRIHRRLTEAAQEWADATPEAKDDFLYSGARLAFCREWAATHRDEFSSIEAAFVAASEEAERQRKDDEVENERRLREAAEAARDSEARRAAEALAREREAEAHKRDAEAAAERQRKLGLRFLTSAIVAGALALASGVLALLANNARQVAKESEGKAKTAYQRVDDERKIAQEQKNSADEQRNIAGAQKKLADEQRDRATKEARHALAQERLAESRRLAALSDAVRPQRLDQALLFALEAMRENTLEARGSLQRSLEERPEISYFLDIWEGAVRSVAFGPGGILAAGYKRARGGGGVLLFDAKGGRVRTAPLEVKEGGVHSVAFGPRGILAAGLDRGSAGGVLLFDAQGERIRPTPIEIQEGRVESVAFGPGAILAAGYDRGGAGGVLLFDAQGERIHRTPMEIQEGRVTSVAFGPEGVLAAAFDRGGTGGVQLFDVRGNRLNPVPIDVNEGLSGAWPSVQGALSPRDTIAPAAAVCCSSTPRAAGSAPHRSRSRRAMS